jgi:hypothetical protein
LLFQLAQPACVRDFEASELLAPFIEGVFGDAVLAANCTDGLISGCRLP